MNYVFVMIGGAFGALIRYLVACLCSQLSVLPLPISTFFVNVTGCFALGVFTAWGESSSNISHGLIVLLSVGLCGAFTTFSTFSADTIHMIDEGRIFEAVLYILASIGVGFSLFYIGRNLI